MLIFGVSNVKFWIPSLTIYSRMKLILSLNIPPGVVGCSKENFDSYFTKLQNICTDNMNEDVKSNAAAAAAAGLDPGKGQHIQQQGNESHFLPCCANTFLRGCVSQNRSIFTQLFMQIREPSYIPRWNNATETGDAINPNIQSFTKRLVRGCEKAAGKLRQKR